MLEGISKWLKILKRRAFVLVINILDSADTVGINDLDV